MLSHSSTGVAVVDAQEDLLRASAIANETPVPDIARLPIRRNVALLSAAVAANAATLQLTSAVASISLARLLALEGLLGLGPALVLAAGALAAVPAGRAMDRRGRIPVLAAGFALGAASCGLAALGSAGGSWVAVGAGLIGVGTANGPARLIRTAGGDMYSRERRARGIALVLFGAVFGALLGPAVFDPLLARRELDGETLAVLWLVGGALQLVALALVAAVRPDPKAIASLSGHESPAPTRPVAPLRELLPDDRLPQQEGMYPPRTMTLADQGVADVHRVRGTVAARPRGSGPAVAAFQGRRRRERRAMTGRATVTRAQWRRASIALLEVEMEHIRRSDELAICAASCDGCRSKRPTPPRRTAAPRHSPSASTDARSCLSITSCSGPYEEGERD